MKRIGCLLTAAVLAIGLSSCADDKPLSRTVTALDTVCTVSLYDGKTQDNLDACVRVMNEYEALWSRTIPASEVSAINTADGAQTAVSPATYALVQTAKEYTMLTDGAFDITTAPLTDLWKAAEQRGTLPDEQSLAAACATVGADKWHLTDQAITLDRGTQIDLGAIAKGAVADAVAAELRERGCTSALINLGGNVVAVGEKPNGNAFHVGIGDPQNSDAVIATVAVRDCAVVTSGSYERGYDIAGEWYSHILDPKTGKPVQNDLLSVTILASNATQADALSTACFVMGYERAKALIDSLDGIEAVFVTQDSGVMATDGVTLV